MSYLVMETHRSHAVVLDNEGRFLKVANLGYDVGQMVDFVVEATDDKTTPFPLNRQLKRILFAVAMVFLIAVGSWPLFFQTIGTVQIQINPNVQMTVNRFDNVTGLEGLNADGKRLIADIRTFGRDIDDVSNELAERAIDLGFLHDGDAIHLSVIGDDASWTEEMENRLIQTLDRNFQHRFRITVEKQEEETDESVPPTVESTIEIDISIPSTESEENTDDLDGGDTFSEPEYVPPVSDDDWDDDDFEDDDDWDDDDLDEDDD